MRRATARALSASQIATKPAANPSRKLVEQLIEAPFALIADRTDPARKQPGGYAPRHQGRQPDQSCGGLGAIHHIQSHRNGHVPV